MTLPPFKTRRFLEHLYCGGACVRSQGSNLVREVSGHRGELVRDAGKVVFRRMRIRLAQVLEEMGQPSHLDPARVSHRVGQLGFESLPIHALQPSMKQRCCHTAQFRLVAALVFHGIGDDPWDQTDDNLTTGPVDLAPLEEATNEPEISQERDFRLVFDVVFLDQTTDAPATRARAAKSMPCSVSSFRSTSRMCASISTCRGG